MDSVHEIGIDTMTEGVTLFMWVQDVENELGIGVRDSSELYPAYLDQSQALQVIMHLAARYNLLFKDHSVCHADFTLTEENDDSDADR